ASAHWRTSTAATLATPGSASAPPSIASTPRRPVKTVKARVWVLAIAAGVPLTACKATRRSDAPSLDVRGWSLAEIEAELQRNDEVLAREGIMVASASVPPTRDG